MFVGCGLFGGVINSIMKKVNLGYDFGCVDVGFGIDNYLCGMVDVNILLFDNFVMCINIMILIEDVLKCDGVECDCIGILLFGLYDDLYKIKVWVDVYYLKVEDVFDLGLMVVDGVIFEDILVYV